MTGAGIRRKSSGKNPLVVEKSIDDLSDFS